MLLNLTKKRQGTHKPCLLTPTKLICIGDFTVTNARTNEYDSLSI